LPPRIDDQRVIGRVGLVASPTLIFGCSCGLKRLAVAAVPGAPRRRPPRCRSAAQRGHRDAGACDAAPDESPKQTGVERRCHARRFRVLQVRMWIAGPGGLRLSSRSGLRARQAHRIFRAQQDALVRASAMICTRCVGSLADVAVAEPTSVSNRFSVCARSTAEAYRTGTSTGSVPPPWSMVSMIRAMRFRLSA
jgi:hypothetical protein